MSDGFQLATEERGFLGRLVDRVAGWIGFARVTAIPPGRPNDGMTRMESTGTSLDRPWEEISSLLKDTREAWRRNPMVRRMIGMTTAYIVGPGISVSSEVPALDKFIQEFWGHDQNRMDIRIPQWSDELARSGELFIAMFTNRADGMSYVRLIPGDLIVEVDYDKNDYERELRYREYTEPGQPEKWWISPLHPSANEPDEDGELKPWILHFAINRPAGTIRGESDLSAILPWIKRYEGWLADRVSLNAAMRAFYFVVYASGRLKNALISKYKSPPAKGSIIVAEEGAERWEAITPQLGARDAKDDGRAIRWMVVAGGLGTALADLGEGEEAGLSKGTDTSEQRRRFLLQRQRYFIFIIASLIVTGFNRKNNVSNDTGKRVYKSVTVSDVICKPPDISAEDNGSMASAVSSLVGALSQLKAQLGDTPEFRSMSLRLFVKYVGESMTQKEFDAILKGDPLADAEAAAAMQQKYAPKPAAGSSTPKKPAAKESKK